MIAKRRRRPHRYALSLTPSPAPTLCHGSICSWLPPVSHSGFETSDPQLATRHSRACSCRSPVHAHHASCLPSHRDGFAARPSRRSRGLATTKALTPAAVTPATGLSAYSASPSQRSVLNRVSRPPVAFSVASAPAVIPGFATGSKARRKLPPKQVRYPTDRWFASSCSPPRLAATQLLSTSGPTTGPRADLHHADKASSRTHDPRFRGDDTLVERVSPCKLSSG